MALTAEINLDIGYLPSQNETFFQTTEKYCVVQKGRRAGFTRGAAQYVIECLLDDMSVLWVDTVQQNLDQYYQLYFLPVLKQLPSYIWQYKYSTHDLIINDAKLHMRSAERSENIEGFAYGLVVMNEAGIILKGQRGRNLWQSSIAPMLMDFNPRVFFIGTPKGKKAKRGEASQTGNCLYYELAEKGYDSKEKNWITKHYSSYTNHLLSKSIIEQLESEIPYYLRRQEIYGEFLDIAEYNIFKETWFQIQDKYTESRLRRIMSLDTAFKTNEYNDNSAGIILDETKTDWYIYDCFNEKLEFPQLIEKTIEWAHKYNPDIILIEDKASGQSLIQMLKQQTRLPIKAIKVDSDKFTRASAITTLFETGKVHLISGPWNNMFINQMCEFNALLDTHDDIVAAVSQALNYSKSSKIEKPVSKKRDMDKIVRKHKILTGY